MRKQYLQVSMSFPGWKKKNQFKSNFSRGRSAGNPCGSKAPEGWEIVARRRCGTEGTRIVQSASHMEPRVMNNEWDETNPLPVIAFCLHSQSVGGGMLPSPGHSQVTGHDGNVASGVMVPYRYCQSVRAQPTTEHAKGLLILLVFGQHDRPHMAVLDIYMNLFEGCFLTNLSRSTNMWESHEIHFWLKWRNSLIPLTTQHTNEAEASK